MILKELFMNVDFDNLCPYLKTFEKGRLDNIYAFREAYDRLRNMEPTEECHGEAYVEWSGNEFGEKWIRVSHLDDDKWENELAKEIVIPEDVHLTTEEIAMTCLWEITFYGFSPAEVAQTFDRMTNHYIPDNNYAIALDKLRESIWKHQTPRKYRRLSSSGERCTDAFFVLNRCRTNKMNRSKRKREYRQQQRETYLGKMNKREMLIRNLTAEESDFSRSDLNFLLNINYGTRYDYTSVTHETDHRLDYILDSMIKYQQVDLSPYDSAIIALYVSPKYPLNDGELDNFKASVRSHLGYKDILFGTIEQENDNEEVTVTLLLNKRGL